MSTETKELRELSIDELATRRRDLKEETLHLRVQQESGQLENSARLREIRRGVSRIETILSERRLSTVKEAPKEMPKEEVKPKPKAKAKAKAKAKKEEAAPEVEEVKAAEEVEAAEEEVVPEAEEAKK